ncbi:MAG: tRNA 4-thiouridine(8) synthase ThiI [Ruminococcaceae bacterium]|nr:tRNA 4-thiouridine(8) synthase ThiI [Oscillospiraceae bacterium]
MSNKIIMCRYGEIILKGLNRPKFESALTKNIKEALEGYGEVNIWRAQGITYVEPLEGDSQLKKVVEKLKCVFGIVSLTIAHKCEKNLESIKQEILNSFTDEIKAHNTFKVNAKRADKKFPYKSPQICDEIGGFILENFPHLKVDVNNPSLAVTVEIRDNEAFVHTQRVKCSGGMPVGTNGKAMLLLSGGIDSPVAGYMIAKRGVKLEAVHFFSYPYTGERAKDKVLKLASIVAKYNGEIKVHIVPFTEIQLEIREKCPEEHLTLVMRRFMMQIAERVAKSNNCQALVTGESIGQVASQTIGALNVTNDSVNTVVFRPLIGMDKEEIVEISRKIDAFETSILPYEDCCTVFTPRHPSTKPRVENVVKSQQKLDIDRLIDEAVAGVETLVIKSED